ncbi:transposable element Tcb2 transposase [Trichonephila clavipes]|nr:transposable element Tcb2 transposase [Trichonephila clavipes]
MSHHTLQQILTNLARFFRNLPDGRGDFGLSNTYQPKIQLRTHCGSLVYAAPELFQHRSVYGAGVDLWSLGVILYSMVVGSMPFEISKDQKSTITQSNKDRFLRRITKGLTEQNWEKMGHLSYAIQPEVRFIAKQNSLMKIGNNGNLVLGPFDESTPCLMIVLMNCHTKLRINLLTAVKSVAILENRREGPKITDVAREFDIAHSVVLRLWKSFKTTEMCSRRHGRGRVRSTPPAEDRYIVLSAKRNRRTTAQQVANQFLAASGKQISRKTVARRLRGGGLYARRPVVCVPLTRQHRTARLQWCREHHNWTEQDWACVLFSYEIRFSLSSDCKRQLIWRENGTAYRPENIQEKDRNPTCSIMVWAGIMINGRTRLHVVANGTMTGQRYIDEVLLPHVRLFRGAVGDKFVFMDGNATCHRTLAVQDCLDSEGIQRLVWPARSPDLNPIENVWDAFGRQVAGRNYPLTNKNTLIRALTEEWDKLPQKLIDNVVQSIVRRVECCITLHGGHIPY